MKRLALVVQFGKTKATIHYPCNDFEMDYIKAIIKNWPAFLMFIKTRSHKTLLKLEKDFAMLHIYKRINGAYQWSHTTNLEYAFGEIMFLLRSS